MDCFIEIAGNSCKIASHIDYDVVVHLDLELSYMLAGVQYSPKVSAGAWDGRTRLLSKSLGFQLGLLERVCEILKEHNLNPVIVDKNKYKSTSTISISDRLIQLNKQPRDYQLRAVAEAIKNKRGVIKITTGGGKTLVAALIVAEVGRSAVVYVIGKDLLWQIHKFFEDIFQREIGVVGDGVCIIKPITIASIWTVGQVFGVKKKPVNDDEDTSEKAVSKSHYQAIQHMVSTAEVSIMDECHLAAAETVRKIAYNMYSQYCFGMSASPYRDDNADLQIEAIFGKIIVNISASELIEKGYLIPPHINFMSVPSMRGLSNAKYKEIYKRYIVENPTRNNLVLLAGSKLVEQGFTTLVLFKEIEHGNRLHEMFDDKGIRCRLLNGKMPFKTRQEVVGELEAKKCDLILASSIFDIGVDIPMMNGLVLAGGGKSSVRAVQRIGRVIRPYQDQTLAAIVDFNDSAKYLDDHSIIRKNIYSSEPGFNVRWFVNNG